MGIVVKIHVPIQQGRACRLAGTHHLPGSCSVSTPSWASIVRDGMRADHQPAVSRQDFLALYERCIASGLQMRIVFRHQAGNHEISLSCRLSASSSDAHAPADVRRCRQRRKCAPAASCASPLCMEHAIQQRRLHLHLHHQMLPPQPTIASPPAKRTPKAARRRCEAELLCGSDADDDLQLSPISQARPAPLPLDSPSSPTPIDLEPVPALSPLPDSTSSPPPVSMPAQSVVLAESPAGL
jgi:hypothetical protein